MEQQALGRFAEAAGQGARKTEGDRKEPGHVGSDVTAVVPLVPEVEAAHTHGVAAEVLGDGMELGDGGRGEDVNKGPERNGHTEVSQLAMEATHILAARNELRMAGEPGEGDAEEQSCKAAAASAPW